MTIRRCSVEQRLTARPLRVPVATHGSGPAARPQARLTAWNSRNGSGLAAAPGPSPLSMQPAGQDAVLQATDLPADSAQRARSVSGFSGASWDQETAAAAEPAHLQAVLEHEFASNTLRTYRIQWQGFCGWAAEHREPAIPARPSAVAAYLAERLERHGRKPATLRVAASAIAFVHRIAGVDDPCVSPEVRSTLRSAARKAGRAQRQAKGLTEESLIQIQATAREPRRGRGGRPETPQAARVRGAVDIALISTMRDAMLRVSEAAALRWRDLEQASDGSGRLLIQRSKTDTEAQGAVAFVSPETMLAVDLIRPRGRGDDPMFGLRPNQIARRINQAARAAGLGGGFSGHSPRVGMAQDLARAGIELPSLMTAGRWRSPAMPAHYTRNETAARGAVAQFYVLRRFDAG